MIDLACEECNWSDEFEQSEMPYRCPECGERVERKGSPSRPEETYSDKI